MNNESKARQLIEHLQTVMDEAECADKNNPACCDDLSVQEIRVLRAISQEKCCIMSAVAGAIRLSLSSVTGLIDRLVEKKLVRRDRSHEDRRVVQVELTEEGRELQQASSEGRLGFARDLLKTLSAEEQEALLALFGKIAERIRKEKAAA